MNEAIILLSLYPFGGKAQIHLHKTECYASPK